MLEFKNLVAELYSESTIEEQRLLKKIVYKLKLPESKKDEIWTEIIWLGGVLNDFEGV